MDKRDMQPTTARRFALKCIGILWMMRLCGMVILSDGKKFPKRFAESGAQPEKSSAARSNSFGIITRESR